MSAGTDMSAKNADTTLDNAAHGGCPATTYSRLDATPRTDRRIAQRISPRWESSYHNMKEHAKTLERELNVAASRFVTEIISRGECVGITRAELDEIPKDNWYKYCQHRLTKDHTQALASLRQYLPENNQLTDSAQKESL